MGFEGRVEELSSAEVLRREVGREERLTQKSSYPRRRPSTSILSARAGGSVRGGSLALGSLSLLSRGREMH